MNPEILGCGWEGCVIKYNNDEVIKIGFYELLINEFNIMRKLNNKYKRGTHYMDMSNISLNEYNENINLKCVNLIRMIEMIGKSNSDEEAKIWCFNNVKNFTNSTDYNTKIYQLKMPFISGNSINKIRIQCYNSDNYEKLNDVKINNTIYNKVCKIHNCPIIERIIELLKKLYIDVIEMNEDGIFHNDLNPDNLILSQNKITIIDWGYLTFDKSLDSFWGNPAISDPDKILEIITLLLL